MGRKIYNWLTAIAFIVAFVLFLVVGNMAITKFEVWTADRAYQRSVRESERDLEREASQENTMVALLQDVAVFAGIAVLILVLPGDIWELKSILMLALFIGILIVVNHSWMAKPWPSLYWLAIPVFLALSLTWLSTSLFGGIFGAVVGILVVVLIWTVSP